MHFVLHDLVFGDVVRFVVVIDSLGRVQASHIVTSCAVCSSCLRWSSQTNAIVNVMFFTFLAAPGIFNDLMSDFGLEVEQFGELVLLVHRLEDNLDIDDLVLDEVELNEAIV